MDQVEKSAASVEEAVEAALAELGVSEQQVTIEILQEGRSGFLGLNPQPAVVRVSTAATTSTTAAAGPPETTEEDEDGASIGADFLEELLDRMGITASVEINSVDGGLFLDVWADDTSAMAPLIGKHGQGLDSLQELVRAVVHRKTGRRSMLFVDIEDYRKRRRSRIVEQATEAAQRVRDTGKPRSLGPMTAQERKVVHEVIAPFTDLRTESHGQEPGRRVVIRPGPQP